MSLPNVGDPAPPIALPDDTGTVHDLTDQRGRWTVLYFYPTDDTTGCTIEACEFRDLLPRFDNEQAVVLGISKDSIASHCKFRDKYELTFALLSDPTGAMIEAYGAWGEKNMYGKKSMGIVRSTVVVGPDGKVQKHYAKVKADGHAAQVLADLGA